MSPGEEATPRDLRGIPIHAPPITLPEVPLPFMIRKIHLDGSKDQNAMLFGHQLLHPCDNTSVGLIYYPAARELGGSCSKTILSYEPSSRRCPLRNCLDCMERRCTTPGAHGRLYDGKHHCPHLYVLFWVELSSSNSDEHRSRGLPIRPRHVWLASTARTCELYYPITSLMHMCW